MKTMPLYGLSVPCKTSVIDAGNHISEDEDQYHLNPEAIIRRDPDGVVITPPMLYSTFLRGDQSFSNLIRSEAFSGKGLPKAMLTMLIENSVVSKASYAKTKSLKEMRSELAGLPVLALLEVTSSCNCDCVTCYHKADLISHTPSLAEIYKRIDKLEELGIGLIEVTGGEPFLRNDLGQILGYIKSKGLLFYLVSNGEYLKDISRELVGTLRDNSLGIAVSLDGGSKTHDVVRQRPGLYVKLMKGLEKLTKEGVQVYLVSTINEKNIACVDEMVGVAERFNTFLHLRPTVSTGAAAINDLGVLNWSHKLSRYFGHPNIRNGFVGTKKTIPESAFYGCGIRWRISVSSQGEIFPCVMDRSKKKKPLESYSGEELARDLRKETLSFLKNHEVCRNCEINKDGLRCGGFCRFSNSYLKQKRT